MSEFEVEEEINYKYFVGFFKIWVKPKEIKTHILYVYFLLTIRLNIVLILRPTKSRKFHEHSVTANFTAR